MLHYHSLQQLDAVYTLAEHCENADELTKFLSKINNNISKAVKSLVLNDNPLTDQDLQHLSRLCYLERLSLSMTDFTGSCFDIILKIPGLKDLDISACPISSDSLQSALQRLKSRTEKLPLEILDLNDANLNTSQYCKLFECLCEKTNIRNIKLGNLNHLKLTEKVELYKFIQDKYPNINIDSPCFGLFSNIASNNKISGAAKRKFNQ